MHSMGQYLSRRRSEQAVTKDSWSDASRCYLTLSVFSIFICKWSPCGLFDVKRSAGRPWLSDSPIITASTPACLHPPTSISAFVMYRFFLIHENLYYTTCLWVLFCERCATRDTTPLLTCQFTFPLYAFTQRYNFPPMAAILSNHEALLIYFPLIMLICPADSKPLCTWKIKKNGGYLFLLQLPLPHIPDISHSAVYLKIETHKGMEERVHQSVIIYTHIKMYIYTN